MVKVTCPKCGEEITIDKSQYDSLLSEIKTDEVNKAVAERVELEVSRIKAENKLEDLKTQQKYHSMIDQLSKEKEFLKLEIQRHRVETDKRILEVTEAMKDSLNEKDKELAVMQTQLAESKKDIELDKKNLKEQYDFQLTLSPLPM